MSGQDFADLEINDESIQEVIIQSEEPNLSKKLERRRRIEDLMEERRLREEIETF